MLEADSILCQSSSGRDALRKLVAWKKAQSSQISMAYIARKLGIKSKGYVSDILNGKENLHAKHWEMFSLILGLDSVASDYLKNLLTLDQCDDPTETESTLARLDGLKKMMAARSRRDFLDLRDLLFAFEVFCSFSIFANKPTRRDLISFFGRDRVMDVERALNRLLQQGFVSRDGETWQVLAEKDRFLHFFVGESRSHLDIMQAGFEEGRQGMADWFDRTDLSCFATFLISVNQAQYQQTLKSLKQDVRKSLVTMESPDADMLVRFNLQIFPKYLKDK